MSISSGQFVLGSGLANKPNRRSTGGRAHVCRPSVPTACLSRESYGVFAFKGLPPFDAHRGLAGWIHLAILIGVGLAFVARVPWRLTGINIGLFVLVGIQYPLAYAGIQSIAALHVVNGVLIFVVTLYLTWEILKLPLPATAPASAPASAMTR